MKIFHHITYTIPCRDYTDKPHVAGSEIQLQYGEKIVNEWKSFKVFDKVESFPYNVLLSYLEEGETNVVQVFSDSGQILHEFKGKEKVLYFLVKSFKAVFHFCISPSLAKNYDNKTIFLGSFAFGESSAAPRVDENLQLSFDLSFEAPKNS